MAHCPNKNLEDYQKLVDSIGEKGAFYVFIKNGNKVPYIQSRESNRYIWDVENKYGLVSWSKEAKGMNKKLYKGFDRNTADKLVKEIRDNYIGDYSIVRIAPDDKGEFGLKITGIPVSREEVKDFAPTTDEKEALDNFLYYDEFKLREKEANEDILPIDTYDQKIFTTSRRKEKEEIITADSKSVTKLKQVLMSNMPYVKEVIFDRTLEVAGRLHEGGEKISVNPDYMTIDTLGHEFGHLLIDLRGGIKDPFIQEGIEQLRGTKLWAEVETRYPELKDTEKLEKEVLAEAIGLNVAEIFQQQENASKFEKWLLRFFRWLNSRLGINKNNARELARELVGDKKLDADKLGSTPVDYYQDQKAKIDPNKPETIKEAILSLSKEYRLSDDQKTYEFRGKKFKRVSRVMGDAGYGMTEEEDVNASEAVRRGQNLGSTVHEVAESISKGTVKQLKLERGFEITPKAVRDLENILKKLYGEDTIVLSEVVIGDPEAEMAGTIDVLAITKSGKVMMIDYKTKEKYKKGEYSGFKYYEKGYQGGKSQKEINTMQLSLYKEMLRKSLGIEVSSMAIVQLVADVTNREGVQQIKSIELESKYEDSGVVKLKTHPRSPSVYNSRIKEVEDAKEIASFEGNDITDEEITERKEEIKNLELASRIKDKYQRIRDRAIGVVNARLRRDVNIGRLANVESLKELLEDLVDQKIDDKIAITSFVDNAVKSINSIYSDYVERKKEYEDGDTGAFNIRMFERWHTILSAYSMLDDIAAAMMQGDFDTGGIEESAMKEMKYQLDEAIKKKNILVKSYEEIGGDIMVKILEKFSTRVLAEEREQAKREWLQENKGKYKGKELKDKLEQVGDEFVRENAKAIRNRTAIRLKSEMIKSSTTDINIIQRWFETVLDTNDVVLGAMIKKFVVTDRKARQRAINFRNELLPLLKELEEFSGYTTGMAPEKLYDFMLEKDEEDNYTGNIVSPFRSDLMEAFNKVKAEAALLPKKKRNKKVSEWKEANMPTDVKALNKALKTYISGLIEQGIMTEQEAKSFWTNEDLPYNRKKKLDVFLKEEAAERIAQWKQSNSFSFRKPSEKWKNPQYEKLEKILEDENDPRTKFYKFIVEKSKEADRNLPFDKRIHDNLPTVLKSGRERILAGQTFKEIATDRLKDLTQKRVDEEGVGSILTDENDQPMDFVPIRFIRGRDYEVKDQSFDLATIYYKYYKMAINYGEKSEILPEMEYVKTILESRDMARLDAKGKPITTALATLGERELSKSGQASMLVAQYDDFLKSLLYGQEKMDHGEWDIAGFKIDRAKALDTFSKYTAFSMLGLNMIQAISNVSMGETTQIIESIAGEFFNTKELNEATMEYWKNMGEIVKDIGERAPEGKVNLLNEKWDILNEYEGGVYRKNTKWSQLMGENHLFFMAHAGEHFMQTRVMIAMLKKIKAYNSNGELLGNMYDMYTTEGSKLILNKDVDRKRSKWTEEQEILFGEKVKRLLTMLHGEYSELGKVAAQRHVMGRMGLMFRKFVMPGWRRRFSKPRYNEFLGDFTEGAYRVWGNFFVNVLKDMRTLGMAAMSENWNKLLPRERANFKRAMLEVAFSFVFSILSMALLTLKGEADDDDEKRFYATAALIALRTKSELRFFINPVESMTILRSPAASISTVENIIKLGNEILKPVANLTFELDRYERGSWDGSPKALKHLVNLTPGIKQVYRMRDVEDLLNIFQR